METWVDVSSYIQIANHSFNNAFDSSVLGQLPHLTNLSLDAHVAEHEDAVNLEYLCELPGMWRHFLI